MATTRRYSVLLAVALCLFIVPGCFPQRPADVSRIRGGSHGGNATGSLTVLDLESPDGQMLVAVKYPKSIDTPWRPTGGSRSGNGDDVTHWEEVYTLRHKEKTGFVELLVRWEYSSRTRKLSFGGKSFDFKKNKLAILSYDKDLSPVCEFRDDTAIERQAIRSEFGDVEIESMPASEAP